MPICYRYGQPKQGSGFSETAEVFVIRLWNRCYNYFFESQGKVKGKILNNIEWAEQGVRGLCAAGEVVPTSGMGQPLQLRYFASHFTMQNKPLSVRPGRFHI